MRITPQLKQTKELHALYKKCNIIPLRYPGWGTHNIGVCKVCGQAFSRSKDPIHPRYMKWLPIPRLSAARYVRQQRAVARDKRRHIVAMAAVLDAKHSGK